MHDSPLAAWESFYVIVGSSAGALLGVAGTIYTGVVIRRTHRQRTYQPVFEDWLWHTMLPVVAYGALFAAGVTLERSPAGSLLAMGAASLLLVFIGIHNAWDTVTFLTMRPTARTAGPNSISRSSPGASPTERRAPSESQSPPASSP